jgi:alkylhydroperoxidase/carboxymuconolactone decarboxylase family protein YurZ
MSDLEQRLRRGASEVTLGDVRAEALGLLDTVPDGKPLDDQTAVLIGLAVHSIATALDPVGTREYAERALDLGATPAQVHEVLVVVSGIGVHALMEGSRQLADLLRERGDTKIAEPLDERRTQLWARYVGTDPFWQRMEAEVPGFLDGLVRLSPEAFEAFFMYCAVPWTTGALTPLTKELISLASDATPSHRYLPGLRLHVANAAQLGAGRVAIVETLDIAASAPAHHGVG